MKPTLGTQLRIHTRVVSLPDGKHAQLFVDVTLPGSDEAMGSFIMASGLKADILMFDAGEITLPEFAARWSKSRG